MRKLLSTVAAVVASGLIAYAAPMPNVPISPQYSEPSQIIATLNTLIAQLNGATGYAPAQVVSLGSSGVVSGATPQTLNTQRGVVSFTGVATLATGTVTTLVLNDSLITAASVCQAQIQSGGAAGSGPYVSTATPTAGVLTFIVGNAGTTATGAATFAISYSCT